MPPRPRLTHGVEDTAKQSRRQTTNKHPVRANESRSEQTEKLHAKTRKHFAVQRCPFVRKFPFYPLKSAAKHSASVPISIQQAREFSHASLFILFYQYINEHYSVSAFQASSFPSASRESFRFPLSSAKVPPAKISVSPRKIFVSPVKNSVSQGRISSAAHWRSEP